VINIKRALISVSDKTGLEKLVKFLHECKIEIVSTGGTARFIRGLEIPVRLVSDLTGCEEILDGRVKTLHPKIHGALLALRSNKEHLTEVKKSNIDLIDMVIVNLYPFEKTVAREGVSANEAIENIDIGGPSMLRSAAKNAKHVVAVCDASYYPRIIEEMKKNNGSITEKTSLELGAEVFVRTAEYDKNIAEYLKKQNSDKKAEDFFPAQLMLGFERVQVLRYGENAHQRGAFYKEKNSCKNGIACLEQLNGKELSFNNILDLDAAVKIAGDFQEPAACIIKHNNPCGVAVADDLAQAYQDALSCDPLSAFGSIVGLNRKVDPKTAENLFNAGFVECVIAPEFSQEALQVLKKKKNLRLLVLKNYFNLTSKAEKPWHYKQVEGGLLLEEKDNNKISEEKLKIVTTKKPTQEQAESLIFAQTVAKHVRSNAIVLASGRKTVGIGAGQMSRVDSVIIALRKAEQRSQGAVLASDAFFPKPDAVEEAVRAGICAIIQPGGSKNDEEIIQTAEKAGIAMVMTGVRHFWH